MACKETQRESERERERRREAERGREVESERGREAERGREKDREAEREGGRQRDSERDREEQGEEREGQGEERGAGRETGRGEIDRGRERERDPPAFCSRDNHHYQQCAVYLGDTIQLGKSPLSDSHGIYSNWTTTHHQVEHYSRK